MSTQNIFIWTWRNNNLCQTDLRLTSSGANCSTKHHNRLIKGHDPGLDQNQRQGHGQGRWRRSTRPRPQALAQIIISIINILPELTFDL